MILSTAQTISMIIHLIILVATTPTTTTTKIHDKDKNKMKLLIAILTLTLSMASFSEERFFEGEPAYKTKHRQYMLDKHCDIECLKLVMAAFSARPYFCLIKVEKATDKPWLNRLGSWSVDDYSFSSYTSNYTNWLTALFLVDHEKEPDFSDFLMLAQAVVINAKFEVEKQCLAAGGKIKWR